MKRTILTALSAVLFCAASFAQPSKFTLQLHNNSFLPEANITSGSIAAFNQRTARFQNKIIAVLQFQQLPTEAAKKELAASGIELLNYIPNNAYTVSISGNADVKLLQRWQARSLIALSPQQKMNPALLPGDKAGIQKNSGKIEVDVSLSSSFSLTEVKASLEALHVQLLSTDKAAYGILTIRVDAKKLIELASQPFIAYIEEVAPENKPLDVNSLVGARANVVNATIANGGKGLYGEGVVIGIGDVGNVIHADLSGRVISRASILDNGHATFTHGTAAGAGNINELYKGYAPKATIVSDWFQNIIIRAATYVKDYRMVITNNSYGGGFSCSYDGTYNMSSQILDQQAFEFPSLLHVFAAGNSGNGSCYPYPVGFNTLLGGYQSAKNIITVGNADANGVLFFSSSKGPVKDGRIKPEIVADGTAVVSSWPNNTYHTDYGTSTSAPSVVGGLALLYQRYRQLHNNTDPSSALMKAILINGATDKGNAGPDFSFGFGNMNLLRSIDILDHNNYFSGNSTAGHTNDQTITIPEHTAGVKIMLYWHDPVASLLSRQTLVNDLDLQVIDPANHTLLPYRLDTTAANVNQPATTGEDHVNNIEQVVIDRPATGTYTIKVKGTTIAQNPSQAYVVVYDIIPESLQLTYPIGGEGLVPGQTAKIAWEAYGDTTATFALQYTIDNGTTWNDIATAVPGSSSYYTWTVPAIPADKARVRIGRNTTSLTSTSNPFAIIGVPTVSLAPVQCEGYIALNWTKVTNATDYEVMMLRGDEMVPMATTAATTYTFSALAKDSIYFVSVRARINGASGRRAVAISRLPASGTCTGTISDNDIKLDSILSPVSGRIYTSTALTPTTPVTIRIKNMDDKAVTGFTAQYSLNGTDWVTETVAATIAAGDTYIHTFATPVDFSAIGAHPIITVVKNSGDPVAKNDTLIRVVKQLDNQPIDLATNFIDNLEGTTPAEYVTDTVGITGADRYDFEHSLPTGRLQTFINSGVAFSGERSFILDNSQFTADSSYNYLTGTFNLSRYTVNNDDIRLDFRYIFAGYPDNSFNKIWVRGSDTDPWIAVYHFKPIPGVGSEAAYSLSPSLELADSLKAKGQEFSSSFQIRWGQNTKLPAYDKTRLYSIDDIHLYQAFNDMQLTRIDEPGNLTCSAGNTVPVKITVHNSSNTPLINIPVAFTINGSDWVEETIPTVGANSYLAYTFTHMANFTDAGTYIIKAVVHYPSDTYRLNDTAITVLHNSPYVTSFPYLENFERSDGGWYPDGVNSSWQYGLPASGKIIGAASGTHAWKTRLNGNYNDEEYSYLYSPCFEIGSLAHPALSFSTAMDLEDCGAITCDGAWVEYTTDNKEWKRLVDSLGAGINWYNAAKNTMWSKENDTRWHVATAFLPKESNSIRLRFVMKADESINKEGLAIDDIHIYDNSAGIYTGTTPAVITQATAGSNGWLHYEKDGKRVASILPGQQNVGTTTVSAYINSNGVRDTAGQYYLDRNWVIQPQNASLADSVTVRLYFTDAETVVLTTATGCDTCTKPGSAYELGVAKYSTARKELENGTMQDNMGGYWVFRNAAEVAKVPFDKGYYAEFKTKYFSEFWLSKAAFDNFVSQPLKLLTFTAQKQTNNSVALQWQVDGDEIADSYEIEVARTEADMQADRFETVAVVKSKNSAATVDYSYLDAVTVPAGARYYRIKVLEKTGAIQYSTVQSVLFSDEDKWTVYPNPSTGLFYFLYQVPAGQKIILKVTDVTGRLVYTHTIIGDGFAQKQVIDLSAKSYASGVYLLQAAKEGHLQSIKLYKQ